MMRWALLPLLLCSAPVMAQDHRHDEVRDKERKVAPAGPSGQAIWSQADAHFDPEEMAAARKALLKEHGDKPYSLIIVDRLEFQANSSEESFAWDAQGWTGGDIDKLWVKSEGEYSLSEGRFEEVELQALWSRAITPFFDVQAGIRADVEPADRVHLAAGIQGLAPYWLEVDAAAFLSDKGDLTARIEVEYDLRMTQRLIVQPRIEANLSAQDIPASGKGSGLSEFEAGLRLRYEISPQFAPHVGIEWQREVGDTARFTRAAGNDPDRIALIAGLRFWF